jgi:hypothetical protein
MQISCMLHNYNVSSIICEKMIKFHLIVTEELHGNKILPNFYPKTVDFMQMR